MSRPQHFFHTSEQFHQCCTLRQRPLRDSGIFGFWEGFNDEARPMAEPRRNDKPRTHVPLRYVISVNVLVCLIVALMGMNSGLWAAPVPGEEAKAGTEQKVFATPEDAMKALIEAANSGDRTAMHELFGPEATNLVTGDPVQDAANFKSFSKAVADKCEPEHEGENKVTLNIGTEGWPFPIPLVKQDGQWRFDTDAGREEIINRHIGRDELNAIGVCRAYVAAQQKYFNADPEGSGIHKYAQKFKSSPGKKDGLYWPTEAGAEESPLGPLVEEAHAEGYGHKKPGEGQQPFHGYYFKILTRQGREAPGDKMNYVAHGNMTGGFAMVAYSGLLGSVGHHDLHRQSAGAGLSAEPR